MLTAILPPSVDAAGVHMDWINYHHLHYFWVVAREGGLVRAGKVLHLSHPTLSAQIHSLEEHLGEKLFARQGRRLVLTEMGTVVYRYAEEIFSLGREMVDTVKGRATGQPMRLNVGVSDVVPKLIVQRLLQPALSLAAPVRLVCFEDKHERLLEALAVHHLDIALSDAPAAPGGPVRVFSQLLAESGVTFFGTPPLAARYRADFPRSLDGAPMLLPLDTLPLRRALDQWFESISVRPRIVAEFEDSALLKVFGADGAGLFPGPTVVEAVLAQQHGAEVVGHVPTVQERYYALTVERRLKSPAAAAILLAGQGVPGEEG